MPKFEKKAEKLEAWRTKGNRNVQTADGFRQAQPGQWIVDLGNGLYELLDDADFREKYEPKDKDAVAALKAELKTADEEAEEAKQRAADEQQVETEEAAAEEGKEKAAAAKKEGKKTKKSKK